MKTRTRWFVLLGVVSRADDPGIAGGRTGHACLRGPDGGASPDLRCGQPDGRSVSGDQGRVLRQPQWQQRRLLLRSVDRARKQLSSNTLSQTNAAVSGNKVVYTDYRNGNPDVYLCDLSTGQERPFATNRSQQLYPKISAPRSSMQTIATATSISTSTTWRTSREAD